MYTLQTKTGCDFCYKNVLAARRIMSQTFSRNISGSFSVEENPASRQKRLDPVYRNTFFFFAF